MSIKSLHDFLLRKPQFSFQIQSFFEFRYPVLFDEDSFMIESLNFPKMEANTGNIYLDGYKIPVHSTADFGNEISFSMYVDENDFHYENGKYFKVFNSLLNNDHKLITNPISETFDKTLVATIIPLPSENNVESSYSSLDVNNRTIILYNALIKSISLAGGFVSNSSTLAKFDVSMTYSFIEHFNKPFEESKDGK